MTTPDEPTVTPPTNDAAAPVGEQLPAQPPAPAPADLDDTVAAYSEMSVASAPTDIGSDSADTGSRFAAGDTAVGADAGTWPAASGAVAASGAAAASESELERDPELIRQRVREQAQRAHDEATARQEQAAARLREATSNHAGQRYPAPEQPGEQPVPAAEQFPAAQPVPPLPHPDGLLPMPSPELPHRATADDVDFQPLAGPDGALPPLPPLSAEPTERLSGTGTIHRAQPTVIPARPKEVAADGLFVTSMLTADDDTEGVRPPAEAETKARGGLWLALLRIALGFVFLWTFLDKTFGLGWSTVRERSWTHGISPTSGYLGSQVNPMSPLADWYAKLVGQVWVDWVFMLGMLGIGLALLLGIGLRIAAVCGVAMMAFMWIAAWPLVQVVDSLGGRASSNPLVDQHIVYAVALIVLAIYGVRSRYGLGAVCRKMPAFLH